jgi:hypothetical protein
MSRFDRVMARRLERVIERRRPKAGHKTGVIVLKQHLRGDRWWRAKFAELIEKRTESRP